MPPTGCSRYARSVSFCVFVVLGAASAAAQDGSPPGLGSDGGRDFLFGAPRAVVSVRGGWVFTRAGSDLFDFVTDQLTLEKRDFHAPAIGAEVGVPLGARVEAVGGVEWSRSTTASEYRRFVDNNNLPIAQETLLQNLHVSGGVRIPLRPRGRALSRLAWIPRGVAPYVGAGAGAVRWQFTQTGDFVDFADHSVFRDVFGSSGWAPTAHVFGGADLQVYRLLFVQLEARYLWASDRLGSAFVDFDPIDLAGFRTTAGVSFLF